MTTMNDRMMMILLMMKRNWVMVVVVGEVVAVNIGILEVMRMKSRIDIVDHNSGWYHNVVKHYEMSIGMDDSIVVVPLSSKLISFALSLWSK
jgi:hypothetical protein